MSQISIMYDDPSTFDEFVVELQKLNKRFTSAHIEITSQELFDLFHKFEDIVIETISKEDALSILDEVEEKYPNHSIIVKMQTMINLFF